jgi:hypothetical protein
MQPHNQWILETTSTSDGDRIIKTNFSPPTADEVKNNWSNLYTQRLPTLSPHNLLMRTGKTTYFTLPPIYFSVSQVVPSDIFTKMEHVLSSRCPSFVSSIPDSPQLVIWKESDFWFQTRNFNSRV